MGSSQSNIAVKLDLSGKGIVDIEKDTKQPRMLPTFPKLQSINASKNKIERIPPNIAADLTKSPLVIEHLEKLNFSKNKLAEIPECFMLLGPPLLLLLLPSTSSFKYIYLIIFLFCFLWCVDYSTSFAFSPSDFGIGDSAGIRRGASPSSTLPLPLLLLSSTYPLSPSFSFPSPSLLPTPLEEGSSVAFRSSSPPFIFSSPPPPSRFL